MPSLPARSTRNNSNGNVSKIQNSIGSTPKRRMPPFPITTNHSHPVPRMITNKNHQHRPRPTGAPRGCGQEHPVPRQRNMEPPYHRPDPERRLRETGKSIMAEGGMSSLALTLYWGKKGAFFPRSKGRWSWGCVSSDGKKLEVLEVLLHEPR